MGYYSTVKFATNTAGYEKFKSYLTDVSSNLFKDGNPPEISIITDYHGEPKDSVIFGWTRVKWCCEFLEVKEIMDAYRKVRKEYPFEFACIGEEFSDICLETTDLGDDSFMRLDIARVITIY